MSLYTVAGISINKGKVKVRFCSDLVLRVKNLQKQGDTDIQLMELPSPMDKWAACEFLLNSGRYNKHATEIVEIQGKKIPKNTNTQKVSVPRVEVDEEIESIKELIEA